MPLPKSIQCTSCPRTYPEGWKRCPYCGFDPIEAARQARIRPASGKRRRPGRKGSRQTELKPQVARRSAPPGNRPAASAPNEPQPRVEKTDAGQKRKRRRGRRRSGADSKPQAQGPSMASSVNSRSADRSEQRAATANSAPSGKSRRRRRGRRNKQRTPGGGDSPDKI